MLSRRTLIGTSALTAAGVVSACALEGGPSDREVAQFEREQANKMKAKAQQRKTEEGEKKILVAFFSRAGENFAAGATEWIEEGHTKVMAGFIQDKLACEGFEIKAKKAYPEGYDECCERALKEQQDDKRPKISGKVIDVAPYHYVFLGCPIWWGAEPQIIRTFLEKCGDLTGKVIIPFVTHAGSGMGKVEEDLAGLAAGATVYTGFAVTGTEVEKKQEDIEQWVNDLHLR
jgi:flavodoxin